MVDPPPPPVFARGPFVLQQWPFGAIMRPGDWVGAAIYVGAALVHGLLFALGCAAAVAIYLAASTD